MSKRRKSESSTASFNVAHVLPDTSFGGAELAALEAAKELPCHIHSVFLKPAKNGGFSDPKIPSVLISNLSGFSSAVSSFWCRMILNRLSPNVVVFSLWKSIIAFLLFRASNRQSRVVIFLHCRASVHLADRIATSVMIKLSDEVWSDSRATLNARYPQATRKNPTRIISFKLHSYSGNPKSDPKPEFVFWGRLHPIKRLDLAIELFAGVAMQNQNARFQILGQDQGEGEKLVQVANQLGVRDQVEFFPHQPFEALLRYAENARFFLLTSEVEGMSMSVAEAMRMGIVPVVTPVGEIVNYCRHMENSIIIDPTSFSIDDLLLVMSDPELYVRLSRNAIETWRQAPSYAESFLNAARSQ